MIYKTSIQLFRNNSFYISYIVSHIIRRNKTRIIHRNIRFSYFIHFNLVSIIVRLLLTRNIWRMVTSKTSFNYSDRFHLMASILAFHFCSRNKWISRKKVLFNYLWYFDKTSTVQTFQHQKILTESISPKICFNILPKFIHMFLLFVFFIPINNKWINYNKTPFKYFSQSYLISFNLIYVIIANKNYIIYRKVQF